MIGVSPTYLSKVAHAAGTDRYPGCEKNQDCAYPVDAKNFSLDLAKTSDANPELRVDGERVFGSVPALEARGERAGTEYAVHAERLDGDLWEVRVSPL